MTEQNILGARERLINIDIVNDMVARLSRVISVADLCSAAFSQQNDDEAESVVDSLADLLRPIRDDLDRLTA
jgi:hypothetical protein